MASERDNPGRADADSPTTPLGSTAVAAAPASAELLRALGERYELLEELGRGGMGIVYRARDRETGDELALKVLRSELARDEAVLERFRNELRLARKITHKNVCRTYELLRFGEHVVIAMEYVGGESLRAVLRRFGALSRPTVVRMARQICDALAEAHAQGVVHRDLKPENVMVDARGSVKVMDFGIARSLAGGETSSSGLIGTPAYMAPEQIDGKPVDARTDIYALGLMLHEMLSGQPVFEGVTPVTIAMRHLKEAPQPLRDVEPSVPAHVERAVLRCLEKSPGKRFATAAAVAEALEAGEEERAHASEGAATPPLRLARWGAQDWWLAGAAGAGAVLLALLWPRVLPYESMRLPFGREEAVTRAKKVTQELNAATEATRYRVQYGWFRELNHRAVTGNEALPQVGRSAWSVSGEGSEPVDLNFTLDGRLGHVAMWPSKPPAAASPGASAEVEARAKAQAERWFGVRLSEPARKYRWDAAASRLVYEDGRPELGTVGAIVSAKGGLPAWPYGWEVREEGERPRLITVWATATRTWSAGMRFADPGREDRNAERRWLENLSWGAAVLGWVVLLASVAGFLRMEKHTTVWPMVGWGALAGLGVGVSEAGPQVAQVMGYGADWSEPSYMLAAGCMMLLMGTSVMTTVHYYTERALPGRAATLAMVFTRRATNAGTGLGLIRGMLAGTVVAGGYLAAVWPAARAGAAEWSTMAVNFVLNTTFREGTSAPTGWWGVAAVAPAAVLWTALVALPVALAKRASGRAWAPYAATALLWTAAMAAVPGTGLFPSWAMYAASAAQGAALAYVLLRYDVLTVFAAIATLQTLFVVLPAYRVTSVEQGTTYAAGFAPMAVMALAAVGLSGWQRVRRMAQRTKQVLE